MFSKMNSIIQLSVLTALFCVCIAQDRIGVRLPDIEPADPRIPVPCLRRSWGPWGPWSRCSVTCGTGVQTRKRSCVSRPCIFPAAERTPERSADVESRLSPAIPSGCIGPSVQMQRCPMPPCECHVDGGWSNWGCWGACIKGRKQRHRVCNRPIPEGSGSFCRGPHTTSVPCSECAASQDIVFVIDSSGSIGQSNFNSIVSQVNSLINTFDLDTSLTGPTEKVRVGILLFNHGQILKKHLNQFAVPSIPYSYSSGGTNIGGAINYARTQMFVSFRGDRPLNPNTLVLITDGWSSNAVSAANAAKNQNITIIAVGVGSNVNSGHLSTIVSDPASDNMYTTSQFCAVGQYLRKRFDCPQLQSRPSVCTTFTPFRPPTADRVDSDAKPEEDFGNF